MKVTLIPIIIGTLGSFTKGFVRGVEELEIAGRTRTLQTIALLRTARITRRVQGTFGDLSIGLQFARSAGTSEYTDCFFAEG